MLSLCYLRGWLNFSISSLLHNIHQTLAQSAHPPYTMSTLGEELKEKEGGFDEASTAAATPMDRSTANSIHSSKNSIDKERATFDEVGAPLEPVESSMYPGMAKLIPILVAIVMSVFLVALDMTIITTAIPAITDQFHSLQDVGWYGSAFFLTIAGFQSTWGKAYKYFPLKWSFMVVSSIYGVSNLVTY